MPRTAVTFIHETDSIVPSLVFLPPEKEERFFIRIFLRSGKMDLALGNPMASRKSLHELFPVTGPLVAPQQVHGTSVVKAAPGNAIPERPKADGVLISAPGVEGSLRFADCFPVVIASAVPSPWIAILHSGYKGTVLDITGKTCESLFRKEGADPSRTWAWIGPGIGKKHYFRKMGEEWTTEGLRSFFPGCSRIEGENAFFDLGGEIRQRLLAGGLKEENICSIPLCTFHNNDVCYSYRNGDRENRLFLLAWLR